MCARNNPDPEGGTKGQLQGEEFMGGCACVGVWVCGVGWGVGVGVRGVGCGVGEVGGGCGAFKGSTFRCLRPGDTSWAS